MNDLQVQTKITPAKITSNFDEIRAGLEVQMEAYKTLEVTEDNITERKADVATLRKIRAAIDDKRKSVKTEYNKPLSEFEAEVKSVEGIIDEAINHITTGLNEFEQKRIAEKRKEIEEIYTAEIGDLAEFLPLNIIRSSKWENKTFGKNEIISEIQEMKMRVERDLEAIKALGSDIEEKLIQTYKGNGNNLAAALQKHTDYMNAKRDAEERVRKEAEEKARREAEEKARKEAEAVPVPEVAPTICQPAESVPVWDEPTLTIRVKGAENIDALKTFLDMSEIEYQEV